MKIYAVNINDSINDQILENILYLFPKELKIKLDGFRQYKDYKRSLIGNILAYSLISDYLHLPFDEINLIKNKYGKPILKNTNKLNFNVSHSGNWVVCAIDYNPIGIDIELVRQLDITMVASFFSEEEQRFLANTSNALKLSYFYDLWTLKESYIKAIGKGLSCDIRSFTIKIEDEITLSTTQNIPFFFHRYDFDKDYKLSVCASTNKFPNKIEVLEQQELCKKAMYRHGIPIIYKTNEK